MVTLMSPTVCVPPLFLPEVCLTPFFSSHPHSSTMPTTFGLCCLAMATASPMWSPWPCVQSMTSTFLIALCDSGHMGLPMTHGSMRIILPAGVSTLKVAWPSHVSFQQFRLMYTLLSYASYLKLQVASSPDGMIWAPISTAAQLKADCRMLSAAFSSSVYMKHLLWSAMTELSVLISRDKIAKRVAELGAEITKDFSGQSIIFVGVLKGAAIFLADLARQVDLDSTFDFIGVSSYGNRPSPDAELQSGWDSTGEVKLTKDIDQSMRDKNVIVVEDILDTGLTMTYLKKLLLTRQPKALKIAALLDKPSRRKLALEGDYVGFKIPDEFVVGYGLDYAERYRNLPDICVVPRQ